MTFMSDESQTLMFYYLLPHTYKKVCTLQLKQLKGVGSEFELIQAGHYGNFSIQVSMFNQLDY